MTRAARSRWANALRWLTVCIATSASGCVGRTKASPDWMLAKITSQCGNSAPPIETHALAHVPGQYCVESMAVMGASLLGGAATVSAPAEAIALGLARWGRLDSSCPGHRAIVDAVALALREVGAGRVTAACPGPRLVAFEYVADRNELFFDDQAPDAPSGGANGAIRLDGSESSQTPTMRGDVKPNPRARPIYGDMIAVPAGPFTMGTPVRDPKGPRREPDEPARSVELAAFLVDRWEVPVYEYRRCVEAGGCRMLAVGSPASDGCNWGKAERADHPVNCVSWNDAWRYCAWSGKRLPFEAEWEKAARGNERRKYPWGFEDPSCRITVWDEHTNGCGRDSTWPIGSRPEDRSPYGAEDMGGNVREWVADWYDPHYYAAAPAVNPQGPPAEQSYGRVVRGGSWAESSRENFETTRRGWFSPESRSDEVGFRCARDADTTRRDDGGEH